MFMMPMIRFFRIHPCSLSFLLYSWSNKRLALSVVCFFHLAKFWFRFGLFLFGWFLFFFPALNWKCFYLHIFLFYGSFIAEEMRKINEVWLWIFVSGIVLLLNVWRFVFLFGFFSEFYIFATKLRWQIWLVHNLQNLIEFCCFILVCSWILLWYTL